MWNILKCLAYVISVTFKTFDVIKERGYNSEEMMKYFQTVNKKLIHINLNDSTSSTVGYLIHCELCSLVILKTTFMLLCVALG